MIPDSSKLMAITNGDQREQGSTCVDVISKYFQMMTNQIENVGQVEPKREFYLKEDQSLLIKFSVESKVSRDNK